MRPYIPICVHICPYMDVYGLVCASIHIHIFSYMDVYGLVWASIHIHMCSYMDTRSPLEISFVNKKIMSSVGLVYLNNIVSQSLLLCISLRSSEHRVLDYNTEVCRFKSTCNFFKLKKVSYMIICLHITSIFEYG